MKTSKQLNALIGVVVLATMAACSVKQSGGKAPPMPKILSDGTLKPAGATCEKRDERMKEINASAQAIYEYSIHSAFQGSPSGDASSIRRQKAEFEKEFGGLDCDGQTNASFIGQLDRFIDEIERYK